MVKLACLASIPLFGPEVHDVVDDFPVFSLSWRVMTISIWIISDILHKISTIFIIFIDFLECFTTQRPVDWFDQTHGVPVANLPSSWMGDSSGRPSATTSASCATMDRAWRRGWLGPPYLWGILGIKPFVSCRFPDDPGKIRWIQLVVSNPPKNELKYSHVILCAKAQNRRCWKKWNHQPKMVQRSSRMFETPTKNTVTVSLSDIMSNPLRTSTPKRIRCVVTFPRPSGVWSDTWPACSTRTVPKLFSMNISSANQTWQWKMLHFRLKWSV